MSTATAKPFTSKEVQRRFLTALSRGGLGQIVSSRGGSRTQFALNCLSATLQMRAGQNSPGPQTQDYGLAFTPDSSHQEAPPFFIWIAEEGFPYVPRLHQDWEIPLPRFVVVQVPSPKEAWKLTLEALQTGLFGWIFLRTNQGCHPTFLRKLQINAERLRTRVLLLCAQKLAHWPLKISVEVDRNANSLFPKPRAPTSFE